MLGFVTGLNAEARLLSGVKCLVAVGGGTSDGAWVAASTLVDQDVTGLVSFGLAGGLDPSLAAGQRAIPQAVMADGLHYRCDQALVDLIGGATIARLAGASSVATSALAKAKLHELTGAAAVDLESGSVARVAHDAGLPFAVMRVIADPAWRDLAPASLVALDASGKIAPWALLRSIFDDPWQVPGLLRLAIDAAAARRTLAREVKLRFSD